jgi:signal peptidase I
LRTSLAVHFIRLPLTAWERFTRLWKEQTIGRFVLFLGALLVFRSIILDWNQVPTGSMHPTIRVGDHIVVDKLAYDLRLPFTHHSLWRHGDPQPGDIIAFTSPVDDTLYVKRVIGKPGDLIAMIDNVLVINGTVASFSVVQGKRGFTGIEENVFGHRHRIALEGDSSDVSSFGPLRVPPNAWFVMGDNRLQSYDSRYFGFVDRYRILGRATRVAFSLDYEHGFKPRPDRVFTALI